MEVSSWRAWQHSAVDSWDSAGEVYSFPGVEHSPEHLGQYHHQQPHPHQHPSHPHHHQFQASPDIMQQFPFNAGFHGQFTAMNPQFAYTLHSNSVARRNERERNRVRFINKTFSRLRQHLPCSEKKKLSKVDTLKTAIKYIKHLQHILDVQDQEDAKAGSDVTEKTQTRITDATNEERQSVRAGEEEEDDSCNSFDWQDKVQRLKSGSVTSGTDCSLDLDLEDDLDSEKHSPPQDVDDDWL